MASLGSYLAPDQLIAEQLRCAPLFADLPGDNHECLALLRQGAFFEVPPGVEILSPGDPPMLVVVAKGALLGDTAQFWPAGSCLGVAETLAGRPFDAPICTLGPALLYRLDGAVLRSVLATCPAIARRLLADVATDTEVRNQQPPTQQGPLRVAAG